VRLAGSSVTVSILLQPEAGASDGTCQIAFSRAWAGILISFLVQDQTQRLGLARPEELVLVLPISCEAAANPMSIWDLLLGVCFFISVVGSWSAAKAVGSGPAGYALAVITGGLIGGACAWAMWRVGDAVGNRAPKMQPEPKRLWYIRALYCSSVLWIALSGTLGRILTGLLLRLVLLSPK
jgi:hypothetical protein